jgi:hypothetical protein
LRTPLAQESARATVTAPQQCTVRRSAPEMNIGAQALS